jgi:hypothetical protein
MLRAFSIRNFRCFSFLSMEPLERVNVITGRNNVGKTALLEAIFLHAGPTNPELSVRVNAFRGVDRMTLEPGELWGWLFHKKNTAEPISFEGLSEDDRTALLQIALAERQAETITSGHDDAPEMIDDAASVTARAAWPSLELEYTTESGERKTSRAFVEFEKGRRVIRAQIPEVPQGPFGVFLAPHARAPKEDAQRFSQLRRIGGHESLIAGLRELEPRLSDVALLIAGGRPVLHGDVGLGELLPLPLMGAGMVRLASVLLAIAAVPDGVVLIDEVESGFHHAVMDAVWRSIRDAARRHNAQVFATTHSWETIRAAHAAFRTSGSYDFRLHRLEQRDDATRSVSYGNETLDEAIRTNAEIR